MAVHNLRVERNADFTLAVRWLNVDGVPYVLDGAWFRAERADRTDLLTADLTSGITLEPDGWAVILIPQATILAAVTESDEGTGAHYDLTVRRASDGRRRRLLEGQVVIPRSVTA